MLRWPSATDVSKGPETAANPFRSPPAFLEGDESRGEDQAGDEDLCLCFDFDDEAMESQTEWNQNGIATQIRRCNSELPTLPTIANLPFACRALFVAK